MGPSTPISAHLGAAHPCPSYGTGVYASGPVRFSSWLDPPTTRWSPDGLHRLPCLGLVDGPARALPNALSPGRMAPRGQGHSLRRGHPPSAPSPREQPAPRRCPRWRLFVSVLREAETLLITAHHQYVNTRRLFVQARAGLLFQNKYTGWVFSPEMAKEEASQAGARTCSHLPRIFKTALHWNDIRDAWKVWTKRLDEHRVLMHMRVWEEWYACRYELDPGLNHNPLASRRGQSFRHTVNQSHRVPLRFQRGVTSTRWRLYSEVNKDLCMFWKC